MTTEMKMYVFGGIATLAILIGGAVFLSQSSKDTTTTKPLLGQEVSVSQGHVPDGTQLEFNSNPPAGGQHYTETTHVGSYDKAPADGYLVHSLEHGAVILWYNPKLLSAKQIEHIKQIFSKLTRKSILTPRTSMDVPVALSSWGRVLKLKTIDEKQINSFFLTNMYRAPEQAPI